MNGTAESARSATLFLLGEGLEPDDVTMRLSIEPSQAWRQGERKAYTRADGTRRVLDSKHEWGGWKAFAPLDVLALPLEEQLAYWVTTLESKRSALRGMVQAGCSVGLDCCAVASEPESITLSPELLESLGTLGLDVTVTYYPHRGEAGELQELGPYAE
jgi:hypothetical protein